MEKRLIVDVTTAGELVSEHRSFYGDKTSKAVKGFFLNQLYRSWGHTAHSGWARLLLDRRSLVQVPNCLLYTSDAADE